MNGNAQLARQFAEGRERRVGCLVYDGSEQPLAFDLHDVGHFRRLHVFGACRLCFADEPHGGFDIGGGREPRAHLDHRGLEGGAHAAVPSPARRGSSLPARSSACSSSLPPTWVAPMKICGTVICPSARLIMASRPSQSPLTSISVKAAPFRFSRALAAWQ